MDAKQTQINLIVRHRIDGLEKRTPRHRDRANVRHRIDGLEIPQ